MTADYTLLPDSQCDQTSYPSDTQMLADLQAVRRAEHATERDRLWQPFLRLKSTREATVADVTALCRWWWLRGLVEDVKRERQMVRGEMKTVLHVAP